MKIDLTEFQMKFLRRLLRELKKTPCVYLDDIQLKVLNGILQCLKEGVS